MIEAEASDQSPRPPWGAAAIVVGAILVGAIVWFLVFDAWWLNSDGSAYLSVGQSFIDGHGFRLPDGDVLAWWDRPAYPVLLTAPWSVHESLAASIWMSRAPLIVAPALIAAGTLRFTRSLPAAALGGVVAIAQPWTMLAGGSNFVPDGLSAMAIAGGVLAASVLVVATTRRSRTVWLVVALLAVALATLAKETGAVGFLLVGIVVWNGIARPRRWMVLTALVVTIPVVLVALLVANGDTDSALINLPWEFATHTADEVFAGSWWVVLAAAVSVLLVGWAVPRATEPLPLAGLALIAPAIALGTYASGTGLGMRNAALLPYGMALLVGAFTASRAVRPTWLQSRSGRIGVGLALVAALLGGSVERAWGPSDVAARNWDSPATRGIADYLRAHHDDGPAACTLLFCSFYWLAADGDVDLSLLPQYSARPGGQSLDGLHFTQRAGFRGPQAATPPCTDVPLAVTKSDEGFGAVFECALLQYVRETQPRYLVVSSLGGDDTFDGGRLIPYLESNPSFRRVYSTTPADWPRAVAVYQIVGDPQPVPGAPAYYSEDAYEALAGDHGKPNVVELDGTCYADAIKTILASPPGTEGGLLHQDPSLTAAHRCQSRILRQASARSAALLHQDPSLTAAHRCQSRILRQASAGRSGPAIPECG